MGEGGADAAAVEIDDVLALAAREDHAPIESIAPCESSRPSSQ